MPGSEGGEEWRQVCGQLSGERPGQGGERWAARGRSGALGGLPSSIDGESLKRQ